MLYPSVNLTKSSQCNYLIKKEAPNQYKLQFDNTGILFNHVTHTCLMKMYSFVKLLLNLQNANPINIIIRLLNR